MTLFFSGITKKTFFTALIVLVFACGFFLGARAAWGAETKVNCCCGFPQAKPATAELCTTQLTCTPVKEVGNCNSKETKLNSITYHPNNTSCDVLKEKLAKEMCTASTGAGLLSNTSPGCVSAGNCTVCDFIVVFSNIARLVLGLAGAASLFFFVLGGFYMIISQGSKERVEKGKGILKNTVFGLFIVLAAWQMVRVTMFVLAPPEIANNKEILYKAFTDPNYNPCNNYDSFGEK